MTHRRVVFVTGTDTGVGKTVVTAALATIVAAPYVLKPVQTGLDSDEPDLAVVRRLAGLVPGHTGVSLRHPMAPATAARLEGVALPTLAEQADTVLGLAEAHDVLVEGAGGLLVHVGAEWTLLDLADAVSRRGVPVAFVVVARSGLGTLNHAALTVDAIRQRALPVLGVVLGSWPAAPELVEEQNLTDLPAYTGVPVLGRIPEGAPELAGFAEQASGWVSLPDG